MQNSIKRDVTKKQIATAKHNLKLMKPDIDDTIVEHFWYTLVDLLEIEIKKSIFHTIIEKEKRVYELNWHDTAKKTVTAQIITSPSTMYHNNNDNVLASRVSLWIPSKKEKEMLITRLYENFFPWKWKTVVFDRSFCNRAFSQIHNWYCTQEQYEIFMKTLENELEKFIDKWYIIHNFFLYISKEVQESRLTERSIDPKRMFRYSESDRNALGNYDKIKAQIPKIAKIYDKAWIPFTVVNTNDEELWFINFMKALLENLDYDKKSKKIDFTPDKNIVIDWVDEILKYTRQPNKPT